MLSRFALHFVDAFPRGFIVARGLGSRQGHFDFQAIE